MRSLLTIILLFTFPVCFAQAPKEKWGKATDEELTMTHCPIDPSADAAILNNYGHFYFDRYFYFSAQELRTFYHYQVRLKIFTEEGKKYATISVPYRGYDSYEDIIEISGATYNLDENGKIIKTKFKVKNAIWTRNNKDLWNCTFSLPNVKAGSVIEYSYKIPSLDFVQLRNWMFQTNIPVLNSELTLSTPNFYQYAFFSNMRQDKLEVIREDNSQYLQFYSTNVYCNGSKIKFSAQDIPAFQKEILMPDSNRQILKGEFLLASALTIPVEFANFRSYYLMPYLKPLLITTTSNYYEPRSRLGLYNEIISAYKIIEGRTWEDFVKKLNKQDDFGKNMLKAFECKSLIDSFRKIEAGKKRMIAIYDFIKNHIKWNGEYRIFTSSSLEKVFENKTGYSSDINLLLINLLNRSGVQARPVLISTCSYGDVYKELGFFRKFNHVIASVELNGERFLLDATDPSRPFDLLDLDDLNNEGLLINLMDYQWIPLVNPSTSSHTQIEQCSISSEGSYETEINSTLTGYPAYLKRQEILNGSEKMNTENVQSENLPLIINKTFQTDITINDSIVFSPLALNSIVENPFTKEQRTHPIDLKYEQSVVRELNIIIPEGYTLVHYPQSRNFAMQGDFVSCTFNSSIEQNILKLSLIINIDKSYIPPQFYPEIRLFFEKVKNLEKEKVVLKKIQ